MAAIDDIPECFDSGEELVVKCLMEMRKKENRCSNLKQTYEVKVIIPTFFHMHL